MAEKTEDALGGIAAPKAEEAKSAAKTYETPLKEAYEAGDLPAPESAVGGTGNGSGVRPADPNGPEERIARLRRQSAWLAAAVSICEAKSVPSSFKSCTALRTKVIASLTVS